MTKYYCVLVNNSHPITLETLPDGTSIEFTENLLWAEDECKDFSKRNPDCTYEVKEIYYADPAPIVTREEIFSTGVAQEFIANEHARIYNDIKRRCEDFVPNSEGKAHGIWLVSSRIINLLFSVHFQMGVKYAEKKIRNAEEKGSQ